MSNPIYGLREKADNRCMAGGRYFCMLIVAVWVGMTGCKGDTSPEMVTEIQLAEKEFTLGVGSTYQLNVLHFPVDISTPSYKWTSDNEEVVSVYGGLITGKAVGEALVIVEIERLQLADTCRVIVREVSVEHIAIEPSAVTIQSGETVTLTPVVTPTPTELFHYIWESQDPEIATVEEGVVTGLRGGSSLITVKTVFSELVGTAVVTVERDLQQQTIEVATPGTLESLLDPEVRLTDLTLTGRIDARDLKVLSRLEDLYFLDMEKVQVEGVLLQMGYFSPNELLAENFYKMRIDRVILPEQLQSIPARCFAYSSLSSIDFPSSVEYIAEGAFMGTSLLNEVSIPGNIDYLPDYLFAESGIEKVELPAGVTAVGSELFRDCIRLTSLELPAGIREMGDGLFKGCTALRSLTLPVEIGRIGDETFSGCISLSTIDLPAEVEEIGEGAFRGCTGLQMLSLPDGLLQLGAEAFSGCTSLRTQELPASLEEIGEGLFRGCTSLQRVTVPNNVLVVEPETFSGCTALTTVELPATLETLGQSAFRGCSSLQTVTIPAGIPRIESQTFSGCTALAAVHFTTPKPPQIATDAFFGVNQETCVIYVPAGALDAYKDFEVIEDFANIVEE